MRLSRKHLISSSSHFHPASWSIVVWGSCAVALGLLGAWGVGVWWLVDKNNELSSRELQLANLEAKNTALSGVDRAARALLAQVQRSARGWLPPEVPAVTLIEEIERLAQEAEVAWETKSAREAPEDATKPGSVIVSAEFTGTRDNIERLLRSLDGVIGRPHPTSLTLEIAGDNLWRGSVTLQAFRAPTAQEETVKEEVVVP
ncbi:MAG: hypothetical protein KatS3mg099_272 [Candidatus Parcubacteria bacterium]|nr:MAG: hypothetical protein KatS3mg099_272 [Candidatus Parcubacteria bacterium]